MERFAITGTENAHHRAHVERFRESAISNRTMGALGAISGLRSDGEEFPIGASISRVEVGAETLATVESG